MHFKLLSRFLMNAEPGAAGGRDPLFDPPAPPPGGNTPPPTPPTPPAPPPPGTLEWQKDWPEELRSAPFMKNFKNPLDVAQAYANAQKMIGADKIPLPSKHAGKDELVGIFRKLGSPEKLEDFKYELAVKDSVDPQFMDTINKVAHEHGVLPMQAKAIMDTFAKVNKEALDLQASQMKTQRDQGLKALADEWGDAYPNEIAKAKAALQEFATPEQREALKKAGLGANPTLLRILAKAGGTLSEDVIRGAGGLGTGGILTPEDARAQRTAIMKDMSHPYYHKDHPGHEAAKAEVAKLFQYEAGKGPNQTGFSVKIS